LEIDHPIALGGMGSASSPAMTAAVSRAGGLGRYGLSLPQSRTDS
jgi:NAD(P)H-dependent flavin oxidoreductase YrpB (nitropropane dioxygenase family)